MAIFSYKAKNFRGESFSGIIEAKDERDLAKIIRQKDLILVSAKSEEEKKEKKKTSLSISFFERISLVDKIMFTRNFKVLVAAGVSIPRAMDILSEQARNNRFKKIILDIKNQVLKGNSLSDALGKNSNVFSEIFYNIIKIGEESGTLENSLKVLTEQMERENELKSRILGAMIYPIVIISAMIIIGAVMLIFVIPQLSKTFDELGVELPVTTKIVINLGNFLASYWYVLIFVIIGCFFAFKIIAKTESGKTAIDTVLLKIPFISSLIRKINSAHSMRTIGSLVSSGVPIVRTLQITSGALSNTFFRKSMIEAAEEIKKGVKLAKALKKYENIFSPLVVQMIEVGEETGETSSILKKLADFYEEEVANATKNLSSVIEPVLMLIIGAVIGFFAVSMVQPMYSMLGSI